MKKLFVAMMFMIMLLVGSLAFAGEKVVYTVKAGDTVSQLMCTWNSQGYEVKKVFMWNPDLGSQVKIGQKIVLYLPDQPVVKINAEEVKKIVDETIAAQKRKEEKKESNFNLMLAIGFGLFCMVALVAFALYMKSKNQPSVKAQKETAKAEPQPAINTIFFVPVEENGLYEAEIEYNAELNRYFIPFRHINGGDRMYEKSEGDARRTVKKCWRQREKYGDQIDKLMAEKEENKKKIRQINNQAKA